MRKLWIALFLYLCFPIPLAAHRIQDGAEQLNAEKVAAVIDFLESKEKFDAVHEPSADSSVYYFREIAQSAGNLGSEVERTLLMYEAIRLGVYDGESFADDADIFTWHRLIHTSDFSVVNSEIERLHDWFAKVTDK